MKKFQDLHVFNCIRIRFEGEEYRTLEKTPQISDDGTYQALALDEENNQYKVTWANNHDWYSPIKIEALDPELRNKKQHQPKYKVVGQSYGRDPNGRVIHFSTFGIGRRPVAIRVSNQYGWEDGCRERDIRFIKNPRVSYYAAGDAYTLDAAIIKGEEITEEEFKSLAEH